MADPATGAWIADSYNLPADNPWEIVGGTSLSAPSWAGLFALANQARVATAVDARLDRRRPRPSRPCTTCRPGDFNDVTTGTNGGFTAGPATTW